MSELPSWLLCETKPPAVSADFVRAHDQLAHAVIQLADEAAGLASQCFGASSMLRADERTDAAARAAF